MQTPYELDLRDLMDARYGVGKWTGRMSVGVGTDCGPAITDGLKQLRASNSMGGQINIPPGRAWMMTTPPDPTLMGGVIIKGLHSQASEICFNNANAAMFHFYGLGNTGGGLEGLALLLEDTMGDTSSTAILLDGTATYQPDNTIFRDVRVSVMGTSTPSYWWNGVNADGSARAHEPRGIRVGKMEMIEIFNCRNIGFYGANMIQWDLDNIGCYSGKGPYGNSIMIGGGSVDVTGIACNAVSVIADPSSSLRVNINGVKYS